MRGLFLTGPSENIENPPEEHLRRMIFQFDAAFWNAGCGDAGLNVARPAWSQDEYPDDDPALIFFFEPGAGFFFQFQFADGDVLVPYDGTGYADLVAHHVGGEPFWVPRACFVSREIAWEIVKNYIDHREPNPRVMWVPFDDLKYEVPSSDDEG